MRPPCRVLLVVYTLTIRVYSQPLDSVRPPCRVLLVVYTLTIRVYLCDHGRDLFLSGVLTQPPHHQVKLLVGDGAISVFVEQGKRLPEL